MTSFKASFAVLSFLALILPVAGCHKDVTVRVNSWPLQYYEVNTLRVPQGVRVEITFVEPQTIDVEGDLPVEVNGKTIKVVEGVLYFGDRKYELGQGDIVRVGRNGEFMLDQGSKSSQGETSP